MKLNPFSKDETMNISSLNEGRNMLFFCFMLVAPFYVVAGAAFLVDLMGLGPEITLMVLGMGMAAWGSLTAVYWANLKNQLNDFNLFCATVNFDENTICQLDVLFDDNSKKYGVLPNGRQFYRIGPFTENFGYNHPTEGLITFNKIDVAMPFIGVPWKDTFAFQNKTQVWFRGLALTSSHAEFVVFNFAPHWKWDKGEWIPTCTVTGSHLHSLKEQARIRKLDKKKIGYQVKKADGTYETKYIDITEVDAPVRASELVQIELTRLAAENTGLEMKNARLTAQNDKLIDDEKDADKMAQQRLAGAKRRHRNIMNMKEPISWRTINFKYVGYGLAFLGLLLFMFWVLGG